jgi:protein-disulfide isomerase
MENKNNTIIIILLSFLIGVVSCLCMLTGVNNAVRNQLGPINVKLAQIENLERNIQDKLNSTNGSGDIQNQLQQIQNRINAMGNGNVQPQEVQGPPPEDMNKVYDLPVGVSSVLGDKNAPVTITEFSDFQCPFCARFYAAIKDVLGAYPGKVKVVIKNFPLPFHPNARPAAKLAMAANEQGQFQGMMELLLQNGGDASDDKIKAYAKTLNLDYNKLVSDYKSKDAQWEKQIQDDMQLATSSDVRGTPTFYLNGRKTNSRDLASFKAEIDPLLK